jgi:hypothetical protein
MPLSPPILQAAIQAAAPDLMGTGWLRLATAIGTAVGSWALVPSNVTVLGVTAGSAGSGVVNGKLFVVPQPLPVSAAVSAAALLGVHTPALARAIGVGVANAFNSSAVYQGTSVGVGAGTDTVVRVVANGGTLSALLSSVAAGMGLQGVWIPQLSAALGTGISGLLMSGTQGVGAVTGATGPMPAAGTSISRVV